MCRMCLFRQLSHGILSTTANMLTHPTGRICSASKQNQASLKTLTLFTSRLLSHLTIEAKLLRPSPLPRRALVNITLSDCPSHWTGVSLRIKELKPRANTTKHIPFLTNSQANFDSATPVGYMFRLIWAQGILLRSMDLHKLMYRASDSWNYVCRYFRPVVGDIKTLLWNTPKISNGLIILKLWHQVGNTYINNRG